MGKIILQYDSDEEREEARTALDAYKWKGAVWDIDIDDSRKKQPIDYIEDQLDQLFEEYDTKIETIDFRLDLERVKNDLSKRVYRFLKLYK